MTDKPLAGVRVLDATSGPMAAISRYYAELGADVIRVEPQAGAGDRGIGRMLGEVSLDFVAANPGKRFATQDRLAELARDADLIVAARGSVAVDAVRGANPRAVVLSVSDFGDTGRFADWAGSEAVFCALSGELSRSGIPDREPLPPPSEIAYACAAAQAAYVGLVGYWQMLRTGCGDHLDFSLLDGVSQALDPGFGMGGSATGGVPADKLPRGRPEGRFQYPILKCRDGFVRICVLAPRQWLAMFEWMGRPEEFADPAYLDMRTRFKSPTLLPAIGRFFADRTRDQIEREGAHFGVPAASVLDALETLDTEHLRVRGAFVDVEVAPGVSAPFPDGMMEVDGSRMGCAGEVPGLPSAATDWLPREVAASADAPAPGRPFAGLRVLDFGVIVVGAETGRLLGDQGADVVKVESSTYPDGARANSTANAIAPGFAMGNRNKRSLGLNLRDPRGKALLLELVRDSDVVLANFKGGTLAALGIDYETLRAVNPRLVMCESSAFGTSGPFYRRMGYGPLVRACSGLTRRWCYPGEPESFSDALTIYPDNVGARIAMIGVLSLLIRRRRTGLGGHLGISQSELILAGMAGHVAAEAVGQAGHEMVDTRPRSQVHRCAGDDEWCAVTVAHDGSDDAAIRDVTGGAPLGEWLATQSPRAAMEALQARGIAAGAMFRVAELTSFSYYRDRGSIRPARHPLIAEDFFDEGLMALSDRLAPSLQAPAPVQGQHTVEIIRDRMRLGQADIDELLAAGVLEHASA